MVPHSWIFECERKVGVTQNIITLLENMANWKTVLASNQEVYQKSNFSRKIIIIITVFHHYDTAATDSKGHKRLTQKGRMQDQSPAIYG